MKDIITKEEGEKITAYAIKNPDKTVGELSKMFNITVPVAFSIIKDAAKKLKTQ